MKPSLVVDGDGLEPLLGEDRLDLVGRDRRVLEADLPHRAAGVVDGELEAGAAVNGVSRMKNEARGS